MFVILFLVIFLRGISAVIYQLDDADYARMPPLMHMDSYEACQLDVDALYCTAEFALVSDKHSPLLNMIKEYSDHHTTHYNHTLLRYGICVSQTCKKFYNEEENADLKLTLEACLNESLSQKYELKVKAINEYYCKPPGNPSDNIDFLDVIVGVICFTFLLANLIGSLCDFYCNTNQINIVLRLLKCFSLRRNWDKLTAPVGVGQDSRAQLLKCIHGLRFLTTCLVIYGHSVLLLYFVKNPSFVENNYCYWKFVFMLAEPQLVRFQELNLSRLTTSYALVLALTTTWFRHFASGPYWDKYMAAEMKDCRQYWWHHIFYINNYFQTSSKCMLQSWYLAVDTQLYVIDVIIFFACRTDRSRKIVLSSLAVIGTLTVVAHIYLQDLDGTVVVSPETVLSTFSNSPYFTYVFTRAHTNLVGYTIGMTLGFLVYHLQKQGIDFQKYQKLRYRLLAWSSFPIGVLCCYSGGIFYADTPRPSLYIRILYAALSKPVFGICFGGIIAGCIFKIEDTYRSILEWRWWTVPSRLTYSAYLLHVALIRIHLASDTVVRDHSYFTMVELWFQITVKAFVAALFFWLLVEAPLNNVIKEYLSKAKPEYQIKKKA